MRCRSASDRPIWRDENGAEVSRSARESDTGAPRRSVEAEPGSASPSVGWRPSRVAWSAQSWRLRGSGVVAPSASRRHHRRRKLSRAGSSAAFEFTPPEAPVLRDTRRRRDEMDYAVAVRRCRRRDNSSAASAAAVSVSTPSARSPGRCASEPRSSRRAPLTAMPKTPWPPRSRSTTSSEDVHS